MPIFYRGFSTQDRAKKFRVTDYQLVKQDLVNHFNIRKGEKLMNPNFGSIIWNTLFEPLTEEVREAIVDDIKRICANDPRVIVDNVTIEDQDSGVSVQLDLRYVTSDQRDTLVMMFDRESKTLSVS